MRTTLTAFALFGLLLAATAWAAPVGFAPNSLALSPRSLGMGSTGIGVADDAWAWGQNPAGLGALNWEARPGHSWAHQGMGIWNGERGEYDDDGYGVMWSAYLKNFRLGKGAGWGTIPGFGQGGGFGVGKGLGNSNFSVGGSLTYFSPSAEEGRNWWVSKLGFMYQSPPGTPPLRIGLVFDDLTDETDEGPYLSFGASWRPGPRWLVAADVLDLSDQTDEGPYLNFGGEYTLGGSLDWKLRCGITDTWDGHKLSLGVGSTLGGNRLDLGWQDAPGGSLWGFGVGRGW